MRLSLLTPKGWAGEPRGNCHHSHDGEGTLGLCHPHRLPPVLTKRRTGPGSGSILLEQGLEGYQHQSQEAPPCTEEQTGPGAHPPWSSRHPPSELHTFQMGGLPSSPWPVCGCVPIPSHQRHPRPFWQIPHSAAGPQVCQELAGRRLESSRRCPWPVPPGDRRWPRQLLWVQCLCQVVLLRGGACLPSSLPLSLPLGPHPSTACSFEDLWEQPSCPLRRNPSITSSEAGIEARFCTF